MEKEKLNKKIPKNNKQLMKKIDPKKIEKVKAKITKIKKEAIVQI